MVVHSRWVVWILVLLVAVVGCSFPNDSIKNNAASGVDMDGKNQTPVQPPSISDNPVTLQPSSTPLVLGPTTTFLPTSTSVPTWTPSPQAFQEPEGCLRPPDDYSLVTIGNATLNARTYWMLQRAQELYGGTIPITTSGITQGSYNAGGVAASFGTHDGGGAVDLTVRNIPIDYSIKWEDLPALIDALRLAGFAAWYRDEREGLTPHIHAIAIGDRDLSPAAAAQLDGYYGYFRGYDGYPRDNQIPLAPRYGTVVICQWMLDMGYRDMRGEALPPPPQ